MDIKIELGYDALKIYFNGVLHLRLKLSALLGVQSWRMGANNYFIEYTMVGGSITTEYDSEEKWKPILAAIDDLL